jgi:hypothetical protein
MTKRLALVGAVSIIAAAAPIGAWASVDVSHFSVTPSTTRAGGHPNLRVSLKFTEPSTGLKDIALHLPAGLTANPSATPFCPRKRLLADLCPGTSKVGSITVVGVAFGLELPVTRSIFNLRPGPAERLRLAVPIYGSASRPGIAAELPVTTRPADGGLDMAVIGLPREVGGIAIRIKEMGFRLKGVARARVKRKLRRKAFLTNPSTCLPATSVLELTSHDAPAVTVVRTTAFTPTSCGPPPPG